MTTDIRSGYTKFTGTSAAAPNFAGAIAVVRSGYKKGMQTEQYQGIFGRDIRPSSDKCGTPSEVSVLHPIGVISNKPWTYLHFDDLRSIINEEVSATIQCSSYYSWKKIGESYKCVEEEPSCSGRVFLPIVTTGSSRIPIGVKAPDWLSVNDFEGETWDGKISRFDSNITLYPKPKEVPRRDVPWATVRLTNASNPNPSSDTGLFSQSHKFTFLYEFTRRSDLDSCTP